MYVHVHPFSVLLWDGKKTILSDTHCFTWSLCIWACQCDNCVDKLSRGILLTSTGQ